VLVSELMLQQTQVERVVPKFLAFLERFPTEYELAAASQKDVLLMWQGLGYNRRARFLHQAAQHVVAAGGFPETREALLLLPGVGPYTAGAICAFAYNVPEIFLETNIRAVLIHHFFPRTSVVSDKALLRILTECMKYVREPRTWYAALMDYGSHLKRTQGNATQRSTTYVKQSTFKGSLREVRGSIIRLLSRSSMTLSELLKKHAPERYAQVHQALNDLSNEALIQKKGDEYLLL
jgi:A/G-specific adenine glycosylase